ncbi:MAG TPA: VIT1/CCC1 transporter family protein [Chlamydiales bacterium]|nr:VIT1/CCC1 transporter family protein [Chlamydiales bacterium]
MMKHPHFKGKEALQHVIDARIKGKLASSEIHGTELPGHYSAGADAAKETAFLLLLFWTLFTNLHFPDANIHRISLILIIGWLFWKVGRSAILGYLRLQRLHRLIEEERWEIEHHRPQEKEELKALYAAKGFSGPLLNEVIDVLMADDNRLLQVMLEEELGLTLGSFEHPLKQASGAAIGVLVSSMLLWATFLFLPTWGTPLIAGLIIAITSFLVARFEKGEKLPAMIWNLAVAALALAIAFFSAEVFP